MPHGQRYNYRNQGQRVHGEHYNDEIPGDLLNAVTSEDNYQCCEILFRSGILSNRGQLLDNSLNIDYSANMRRAASNSTFGTQKVWKRTSRGYTLQLAAAEASGIEVDIRILSQYSGRITIYAEGTSFDYKFDSSDYCNSEPTVNRNPNDATFFARINL